MNKGVDMKQKGLLLVVSGPSGVGKGEINRMLLRREPSTRFSISVTTRKMRPGEQEGVDYFYKTREEFERMIQDNAFLEYTCVFGVHYYGTPRRYVLQQLEQGFDVVLEIDVQGAMRVKEIYPQSVTVFIAPPSKETLKQRLVGRGTETLEAVERRFATAYAEMQVLPQYDYIVVNDVLDRAVDQVIAILKAERQRVSRCQDMIQHLLGGMETL